ncbi:hypothetical protein EYY86_19255 [Hafnia paralvei]|uniref:hypothetical protein n=1 Tax=Hafnia paralvei TaxID=546367 RepID=UPI0010338465|nr:hypothetical protein [Hafnia paralvei]TBM09961.1 hypothetical protein EYY86_19255 [Hafnia paralvei]TBM32136.1 hypothetical protein EYY85_01405 [Hafnia paralvei]
MAMYIPIFSEKASPQKKIDEIRSIFLLAQKQIRQKKAIVTLPCNTWCYVLLPGRIGTNSWETVLSSGYHCLYCQNNYPWGIILHPDDIFYPVITDILSIQNDFVYFFAFAVHSPQDSNQLLTWIKILMENECSDSLPPYALLTFDSGGLIL